MFCTENKQAGGGSRTSQHLGWSSFWKYNVRKSLLIEKTAPT